MQYVSRIVTAARFWGLRLPKWGREDALLNELFKSARYCSTRAAQMLCSPSAGLSENGGAPHRSLPCTPVAWLLL